MKILTSVLMMVGFCAVSMAGVTIDGINYDLNQANHTATITGAAVAPAHLAVDRVTYEGETYAVTVVGKAFPNCDTLKSISSSSVLEVSWDAFYQCEGLEAVSLPAVTNLCPRAFARCYALRKFLTQRHSNYRI